MGTRLCDYDFRRYDDTEFAEVTLIGGEVVEVHLRAPVHTIDGRVLIELTDGYALPGVVEVPQPARAQIVLPGPGAAPPRGADDA